MSKVTIKPEKIDFGHRGKKYKPFTPDEPIRESDKAIYSKLNEGLGGCYERVAYTNIMRRIMQEHKVKSILELNATYIAGVPGFNSVIFAQAGYDVALSVRPRDFEDTLDAWDLIGLRDRVRIIQLDTDMGTPFRDGEFDMVWNHLAFEQYKDPLPLVREMARVSNNLVMNLTLNPFNYGFLLHKFMHWQQKKRWDHGYAENALIPALQKIHKEAGLEFVEWGGCDCPPWADTVDEHFGGSMTYIDHYPKGVRDRWIWCSANPACREHWLVNLLWSWEKAMPSWFKIFMAHHLYLASEKR